MVRKPTAGMLAAFGAIAATGWSQLVTLVSGVVSARILGPGDRGQVALLVIIASVACGVVLLGSTNALTYYVAKHREYARSFLHIMRKPACIQVIIIVLVQALLMRLIGGDILERNRVAAVISLGLAPGVVAHSYGLSVVQGLQLYRPFNILRTLPASLFTAALLLLLVVDQLDVTNTVVVWVGANTIAALAVWTVLVQCLPKAPTTPMPSSRRDILMYGARGFLGTASPLETFRIDQFAIGIFLSTTALGVYVASTAYTSLPRVIAQSLSMVALPQIAAQTSREHAIRRMWTYFVVTVAMSLVVALLLMLFAGHLIPFVFGVEFEGAVLPAQILLGASVLLGGRRILGEALRGMGYAGVSAVAEVLSWIVLLACLWLLAPKYELVGVAISLVLSAAVSLGLVLTWAIRTRAVM